MKSFGENDIFQTTIDRMTINNRQCVDNYNFIQKKKRKKVKINVGKKLKFIFNKVWLIVLLRLKRCKS